MKLIAQPKPLTFVGEGSSLKLCQTIAQLDARKAIIVTDKILVELGLIEPISQALEAAGVDNVIYSGVTPDPVWPVVEEGLAQLRAEQCDTVIGIGGGSSMDAAKVIALAAANSQTNPRELTGLRKGKQAPLPTFLIPTTAGTGSEVTIAAVVSDPDTHEKNLIGDTRIIPKATALDPALMVGMPAGVTAATGMDALTHAIEAYIGEWPSEETDMLAKAAVKLIFDNLHTAVENGSDMAAREAMALASYYAGMAFSKAMVGYVHAIAHQLGGKYGIPHGLANAVVLPEVLEYSKDAASHRLAELAIHTGLGEHYEGDGALGRKLIDRVKELNQQVGIPTGFEQIQTADIPAMASAALTEAHGAYPVPEYLDQAECEAMIARLQLK
ncbi:MAG: iron-containing alcohol dehydrogenase [Cellvibrionaceae bacterium]|nr:iron-containing alcohol dehydrogenase [Cellvibrionaceae bacterium]MCV6624948.1 iron-containing alcohol dehydrogenase [Cellvibrionaceae bacterium]